MDDLHSTFLRSAIQFAGGVLGFFAVFFLFSLLSSWLGRLSRAKPQTALALLPDAEGEKQALGRSAPVILRIGLKGVIGKEDLQAEDVELQLDESRMGELKGGRVKGILLAIDSPGGSAADSDAIYRRLKAYKEKYKIPVHAYVDGYCASGGFFAACAADRISASPASVIGSVGVMWALPFFNVHKVLEKWEIGVKTFAEGKHKDHLNPFRPWKPNEDSDLKQLLADFYDRFVSVVTAERPQIGKDRLVEEYGAQVYSAPESARLGFIDQGNLDYAHALRELVRAAGIADTQPYQVVELKKKKPWFKQMMARSPLITGKLRHEINLGSSHSLQNTVAYLFVKDF